jgi:hypothetical protein
MSEKSAGSVAQKKMPGKHGPEEPVQKALCQWKHRHLDDNNRCYFTVRLHKMIQLRLLS